MGPVNASSGHRQDLSFWSVWLICAFVFLNSGFLMQQEQMTTFLVMFWIQRSYLQRSKARRGWSGSSFLLLLPVYTLVQVWVTRGLIHQSCAGTFADLSAGITIRKDACVIYENCVRGQRRRLSNLDKRSGWKQPSMIEINKDVLFGSMKAGIQGAQKQCCLENTDSSGSSVEVDEWTCCCYDAELHSYTCARWNEAAALGGTHVIRTSVNDHEKRNTCTLIKRTRLLKR